jgi:hypothetical protein
MKCTCDNYVPGEPFVLGRDCRKCWLYHNDEGYRRLFDGLPAEQSGPPAPAPQPTMPSLMRQAANLGGAIVRHVAAGCPTVSEEEKGRRMALCLACEFWSQGRCMKCGCYMAAKTAWAREKCPIGKW